MNIAEKVLPQKTIEKFYLKGDVHFNAAGHSIIANNFIKNFKN